MTVKQSAASRDARIRWLLKHEKLWADFHMTLDTWKTIVDKMKAAGLVSPKTMAKDVRLVSLINDAQKRRREGK